MLIGLASCLTFWFLKLDSSLALVLLPPLLCLYISLYYIYNLLNANWGGCGRRAPCRRSGC